MLNQLGDRVFNDLLVHNDCFGDSVIRISRDTVMNSQGKQVLNLCNSMNIRIINGRFGPESGHQVQSIPRRTHAPPLMGVRCFTVVFG